MKNVIISGEIGFDVMPNDIRKQFDDAGGEDIDVKIATPGGALEEGLEIYNMISDYKRSNPSAQIMATMKGVVASMGTYISSNPNIDLVSAEKNTVFVRHNPFSFTAGDYREMRKSAEVLESLTSMFAEVYAVRSKKSVEEMRADMDSETYLFGDEIMAAGFADEMISVDSTVSKATACATARIKFDSLKKKMSTAKNDMTKIAALIDIKNIESNIEGENNQSQENNSENNSDNNDKNLTTGGTLMETVNIDDITIEWLIQNKPEIVDEIKNKAIEEEHARQQEVDQAQQNSEDTSENAQALFSEARYDSKMNAGSVLVKLAAISAEAKKQLAEKRAKESSGIPHVQDQLHDEDEKNRHNLIVASMKEGMKGGRK